MLGMENFWAGFWTLCIWLPVIMLWGYTLVDLFHRPNMEGWKTVLWLFFIIFVPIIGVIVYWVKRPMALNIK